MKKQRRVIALGFFDGVHLGHGALLRAVKEAADRLDARPCAFTFDKSPTAVITGQSVPLLSTVEDRVRLMRRHYGIEEVVVAPFDAMQRMDWEDFVRRYLAEELGVAEERILSSDLYLYNRNPPSIWGRTDTEAELALVKEKCRELGMGCDIIEKVEQDGITISSTYIRTLVAQGEMERAAQFLGHPHSLTQTVTHGKGIGHSALGFPTVNLRVPEGVIVPAFGVYATRVWFDGQSRAAVTNVGVRPTVQDNDGRVTVEGFILDFDGDLYSHQVRVEFCKRLRGEQKFPTMQALSDEIRRNAEQTREYFGG